MTRNWVGIHLEHRPAVDQHEDEVQTNQEHIAEIGCRLKKNSGLFQGLAVSDFGISDFGRRENNNGESTA